MVSATEKRIYLTRHAEGEHNVTCDYSIRDAILTPIGRSQCEKLNEDTKSTIQQTADLLVTSGLKRTLSTTLVGYPELRKRLERDGKPIIVLPQLQECNSFPSDRGSDREVLEADPEYSSLDLSLLTPEWNQKQGFYGTDVETLKNRGKWNRKWLRDRPEMNIVVVSHGDCLRYMTDGWNSDCHWSNTEVRAYTFKADDDDDDAEMVFVQEIVKEGEDFPTSSGHY